MYYMVYYIYNFCLFKLNLYIENFCWNWFLFVLRKRVNKRGYRCKLINIFFCMVVKEWKERKIDINVKKKSLKAYTSLIWITYDVWSNTQFFMFTYIYVCLKLCVVWWWGVQPNKIVSIYWQLYYSSIHHFVIGILLRMYVSHQWL